MSKVNYTVIDFNERIDILRIQTTRDTEQNVIEDFRDVATVWAHIETKARTAQTQAGERPYYTHEVTVRYNKLLLPEIDAIKWHDKTLRLTLPPYSIANKYIIFELQESYGKEQRPCEFSQLP